MITVNGLGILSITVSRHLFILWSWIWARDAGEISWRSVLVCFKVRPKGKVCGFCLLFFR